MAEGICLTGGRVLDPTSGLDGVRNVYIRDGVVQRVTAAAPGREWTVIDVAGCWVCPGLIDMHVHLRQPGREDIDTIESGTMSAVAGGITSVLCMPDTQPPIDDQTGVEFVRQIAQRDAWCRVFVVATITKGRQGQELSEIGEIVRAGGIAISDDESSVMNAYVMRRALEYTRMFHIPVIVHAEDKDLAGSGVMNEGLQSTLLGLPASPAAAEAVMVARDAVLAELTSGRVHISSISAAHSVELVRQYKSRGVQITADATPHHLALTDAAVEGYGTEFKTNPPLRSAADRDAVVAGLLDGTIDAIASDHSPHTHGEKALEFDLAPSGVVGLETLLPVTLTELHHKHGMAPLDLIALFTSGPARIARLPVGSLRRGAPADLTVIDPVAEHAIDRERFLSKGKSTPFHGYAAKGKAMLTIIGGKVVAREGSLCERPAV